MASIVSAQIGECQNLSPIFIIDFNMLTEFFHTIA